MSIILPRGIALITGAASGIGRATAIAYAKSEVEGICLADISSSGLKEVLQECDKVATSPNFRAITIEIDVSKEDDVKGMVEETVSTFGRIDYAANIDRILDGVQTTVPETTLEQWERIDRVNTRGVFFCMREEIRAMLKNTPISMTDGGPPTRGAILNMGSVASKIGIKGNIAYTAAKHAISGMTRAAASTHGTDLIRIKTLCPGMTLAPSVLSHFDELYPEFKDNIKDMTERTMMKHIASPEEMANQVAWMNSPMNSYMTGAEVVCDGGMTA